MTVGMCVYCGVHCAYRYLRHGTGPPSTHIAAVRLYAMGTLGARESDGNRVSWSCTIVVITRPADTGIVCVCVSLLYPTTDVVYNIILYCLHIGGYMWHGHILYLYLHVLYARWKSTKSVAASEDVRELRESDKCA